MYEKVFGVWTIVYIIGLVVVESVVDEGLVYVYYQGVWFVRGSRDWDERGWACWEVVYEIIAIYIVFIAIYIIVHIIIYVVDAIVIGIVYIMLNDIVGEILSKHS